MSLGGEEPHLNASQLHDIVVAELASLGSYWLSVVESGEEGDFPLVNGQPIGAQARKLSDNDVLQLAGVKMGFFAA